MMKKATAFWLVVLTTLAVAEARDRRQSEPVDSSLE